MAKEKKDYLKLFDDVLNDIAKNGLPLHKALVGRMNNKKFYELVDGDEKNRENYARACEERATKIFEEIIAISEHTEEDHTPFTGGNVIQRDRLRIDARKWVLSKMNPKKYGEKLDVTTDNKPINTPTLNITLDGKDIDLS